MRILRTLPAWVKASLLYSAVMLIASLSGPSATPWIMVMTAVAMFIGTIVFYFKVDRPAQKRMAANRKKLEELFKTMPPEARKWYPLLDMPKLEGLDVKLYTILLLATGIVAWMGIRDILGGS
ncbi:hypothetical protein [Paenibacillus xylanexedens]|uniref:hypothetical protein n=1 Tax=Paenibacillus xylanexedens TaxID=528191 RepID=UPI0011A2E6A1|nr:hypothetical protein [Paenibacillus xylanexedens]